MKVIITCTFCCDNLWKGIIISGKAWKTLGIFFSYLVATGVGWFVGV